MTLPLSSLRPKLVASPDRQPLILLPVLLRGRITPLAELRAAFSDDFAGIRSRLSDTVNGGCRAGLPLLPLDAAMQPMDETALAEIRPVLSAIAVQGRLHQETIAPDAFIEMAILADSFPRADRDFDGWTMLVMPSFTAFFGPEDACPLARLTPARLADWRVPAETRQEIELAIAGTDPEILERTRHLGLLLHEGPGATAHSRILLRRQVEADLLRLRLHLAYLPWTFAPMVGLADLMA